MVTLLSLSLASCTAIERKRANPNCSASIEW